MIRPLFDRVVLLPLENEKETKGGILLPQAAQEKSQLATVVAVGTGENTDGKQVGMQVKVGDKVLYGKYAGTERTDLKNGIFRSNAEELHRLRHERDREPCTAGCARWPEARAAPRAL